MSTTQTQIAEAFYIFNKIAKTDNEEIINHRFYTLKQEFLENQIKKGNAKVVGLNSTSKSFYTENSVSTYGHDYATVEYQDFSFHLKYEIDECPFFSENIESFNLKNISKEIDLKKVSIQKEDAKNILIKIGYSERVKYRKQEKDVLIEKKETRETRLEEFKKIKEFSRIKKILAKQNIQVTNSENSENRFTFYLTTKQEFQNLANILKKENLKVVNNSLSTIENIVKQKKDITRKQRTVLVDISNIKL